MKSTTVSKSSKKLLRFMILALALTTGIFLMSAGQVFAGLGGSATPTYPGDVFVGQTNVPVSITLTSQPTNPNQICTVSFTSIEHTPSCGDNSNLSTCAQPDPGVFEIVNCDGLSTAATGGSNAECTGLLTPYQCCTGAGTGFCDGCAGKNFTCSVVDGATGKVSFTPTGGGNVLLTPPFTTTNGCVVKFAVNVLKAPTFDAAAPPGLQTFQLASSAFSATQTCAAPLETGAGQGSSLVTVGSPCLHVVKTCTSPAACDGSIGTSVAVTNCGDEDLENVIVTDNKSTLTCSGTTLPVGGNPITCTGSYTTTQGVGSTDTVTASATMVQHPSGGTISPDASSVLTSEICTIPLPPHVTATKTCNSTLACDATSANFMIHVCNTGAVAETVTITDADCGLNGASVGTIAAGTCTGDANQPADVACTSSHVSGSTIVNTGGTVAATVNGCTDTQTVPSASCTIPPSPHVTATKTCNSTLACNSTSADFKIHVCNTGAVAETVTITDADCGLNGASVGTIAAGTCTGDANQPADVACTSSHVSGSTIVNTGGTVTASANSCNDTQAVPSASCTIPGCPCSVSIAKTVAPDDGSNGGTACDGVADGPFVESVTVDQAACVVYNICVTNTAPLADGQTLDGSGVTVSDAHLGIVNVNFGTIVPGATVCKLVASQISATNCPNNLCVCSAVKGQNTAVITSAVCVITNTKACDNGVPATGSVCTDTANVACTVPVTGCRMTGGHVNMAVDAEFDGLNGQVYTTGGQIGAPSNVGCCDFPQKGKCVSGLCSGGARGNQPCESNDECPPNTGVGATCPWGDWEHNHHSGPDDSGSVVNGSFAFHSGTAAAPDSAFIKSILCEDPGWCVQARPAPDKQIFWEGTGVFHNTKGKKNLDIPLPNFAACGSAQPVPWSNKQDGTLHYYRAHVGDFGEPAGIRQKPADGCVWSDTCENGQGGGGISISDCALTKGFCPFTPAPVDDKFTALHPLCTAQDCGCATADDPTCETNKAGCPDWYEIEIHCTADPNSNVAYTVAHFITEGNFQLHPPVGSSCQPCGDGQCQAEFDENCLSCPEDCGPCIL